MLVEDCNNPVSLHCSHTLLPSHYTALSLYCSHAVTLYVALTLSHCADLSLSLCCCTPLLSHCGPSLQLILCTQVGCKFGCGIPSMRPNAVSQHETEQCPRRPVWCRCSLSPQTSAESRCCSWLCGEELGGNHPDAIGSCVGKCNDQTASSELR